MYAVFTLQYVVVIRLAIASDAVIRGSYQRWVAQGLG